MFNISLTSTVIVPMKGRLPDATGKSRPFYFTLICDRLTEREVAAFRDAGPGDTTTQRQAIEPRIRGWHDVTDETGQQVPFTADGLATLLNISGMAALAFYGCMEASGAAPISKPRKT